MKLTVKNQPQEVIQTSVFFVDRSKILRDYKDLDVFSCYEILPGRLGVKGEFWMGAVGFEGYLSLLMAPAKRDIDVLGYSIREGEWDWWKFLSCLTIPKGSYNVSLVFSFSEETFFDSSQDVVCSLGPDQLQREMRQICTSYSPDTESLSNVWTAVWQIFEREFSAHVADARFQAQ